MIHSIQIEDLSGSMTAVAKDMARTKIIHKRTIEILADNTGQSFAKVLKDCKTDKYMSAQEALDYGIIDKILEPKKRKK
jgi:ATP-dependent Clp protease protease subunit